MGRQFIAVSATIILSVVLSGVSFAQGQRRSSHVRGGGGGYRNHEIRGSGPRERFRLSPEERQAFQRNAERWLKMNPEQQKVLREREKVRRQQMKAEADAALGQSGLRLDQKARDDFEARYLQERRKIERELRQEIEAKRRQQLPQLNERLKNEFQSHQGTPAGTASPVNSPKTNN